MGKTHPRERTPDVHISASFPSYTAWISICAATEYIIYEYRAVRPNLFLVTEDVRDCSVSASGPPRRGARTVYVSTADCSPSR